MARWTDIFNSTALFSEAQARRLCAKLCARNPDQPRLKTITVIGAYDGKIGGRGLDSKRLTAVMSYMLRGGFLIDPDFEIDVVNFRDKRDFLMEDKKADMVLVSFILANRHGYQNRIYDREENISADQQDKWWNYYGTLLSKNHNAQAWRDRIDLCDAKMVVTFGGAQEIGTHILCPGQDSDVLVPVIATPKKHIGHFAELCPSGKSYKMKIRGDLKTLYNDKANDLPMPWLGFAARRDYLSAVVPGLSDKTCLARQAQDILKPISQ